MFENSIIFSDFFGSAADTMFRRISGCRYDDDVSFITTLRALLMNRLPEDKTLQFFTRNVSLSDTDPAVFSENLGSTAEDTLLLMNCFTDILDSDEESAANEAKFRSIPVPQNWRELEDVTAFFAQKMSCRVFLCEEKRISVVLVHDMNLKKMHLVQCVIPKLIPWYFEQSRLSVLERELLLSLKERYSHKYLQALSCIADSEEFKRLKIASMISNLKRRSLENKRQSTVCLIQTMRDKIASFEEQIAKLNEEINEENYKLNGIMVSINEGTFSDDSFVQFVSSNRDVEIISTEQRGFTIAIRGYLDIFDPEAYETLAANRASWYWDAAGSGVFARREAKKLVLDSIFGSDPMFKIKTSGVFALDIEHRSVHAKRYFTLSDRYDDCFPNPHLYLHSCMGGYSTLVREALKRGDLVDALTHCISSTHSVNVTESASFRHVCETLFDQDREACLEGPDGKLYTAAEAYEYLTRQNESAQEGEG